MKYLILGMCEFYAALKRHEAWLYMGLQDIKLRYRRSILGPWWVTISTAIMIGALGYLWSNIFIVDLNEYMPFFAIGYVVWIWISSQISDAINGFIQFESLIKQTDLPLPIYILRLTVRNFIVLIHNLIIIVIIIFWYDININFNIIFLLPSIILIQLILIMLSILIAIFCTRYRDMNQVITVCISIIFFFTPIIWMPSSLKTHLILIEYNPVNHWIEVIRQPLLGLYPSDYSIIFVTFNAIFFLSLSMWVLGRYGKKVSVWI
jgi:lipopolysaccharide transport system permease protein